MEQAQVVKLEQLEYLALINKRKGMIDAPPAFNQQVLYSWVLAHGCNAFEIRQGELDGSGRKSQQVLSNKKGVCMVFFIKVDIV